MKKIWDWFDRALPYLWGWLLMIIITAILGCGAIATIKWLLMVLGVL